MSTPETDVPEALDAVTALLEQNHAPHGFLTWLLRHPRSSLRRLWSWDLPSRWRVWLMHIPNFFNQEQLVRVSGRCVEDMRLIATDESSPAIHDARQALRLYYELSELKTDEDVRDWSNRIVLSVKRAKWSARNGSSAIDPDRLGFLCDDLAEWMLENIKPNLDLIKPSDQQRDSD